MTITILTLIAMMGQVEKVYNIPEGLLVSICEVESHYKVNAINLDDGGSPSLGVCEIKLTTAKLMGYKGTAEHLWKDPVANAHWAGAYLSWQLSRYNGNVLKAISAYNAGSYSTKNTHYVIKVLDSLKARDKSRLVRQTPGHKWSAWPRLPGLFKEAL